MDALLVALRAAAEPTRLRLLALAARGTFCVSELTEILGQSQPRLSRHLRLLCESGLLGREREGANVWFALPTGTDGALAARAGRPPARRRRNPGNRPPPSRPRPRRARPRRQRALPPPGRRLGRDARARPARPRRSRPPCSPLSPTDPAARLLDIGTGTGRVLELLAPRFGQGLGVDASKTMLALARARLARAGSDHCAVRLADMYRLPLADASFDVAVHADGAALCRGPRRRARRGGACTATGWTADRHRPGGPRPRRRDRQAGASLAGFRRRRDEASAGEPPGLAPATNPCAIAGPLAIRIWPATRAAAAMQSRSHELVAETHLDIHRRFIRGLPKAELHMHLEGSIEPDMMLRLARRNDVALRWETPEALRAAYEFDDLQSFLDLYYDGCRVMLHERDYYDVTRAYLDGAHADGVRHAEFFVAPQGANDRGVATATVLTGVLAAIDGAARAHGISAGMLIIAQRHRTEAAALQLIDDVLPWSDRIAGFRPRRRRDRQPAVTKFARYFQRCRELGFRITAHAGEEGPAAEVRDALVDAGVDRVDHGVACMQDAALVRGTGAKRHAAHRLSAVERQAAGVARRWRASVAGDARMPG